MVRILITLLILITATVANSEECDLHSSCVEGEVCTLPAGYIKLCWSEWNVCALKYYKLSYGHKSGEYIGHIIINKDKTEHVFNFNKSGDWFLKITTAHNIGHTGHHEMSEFDELHLIIDGDSQELKNKSLDRVLNFIIS